MAGKKRRDYTKYPLRQCRYLNGCELCGEDIVAGEFYYDGGHGRRAHEVCVHDPCHHETEQSK